MFLSIQNLRFKFLFTIITKITCDRIVILVKRIVNGIYVKYI